MYRPNRIWRGGGYTLDSIISDLGLDTTIDNTQYDVGTSQMAPATDEIKHNDATENMTLGIFTPFLSDSTTLPATEQMIFYENQQQWMYLPYFRFNISASTNLNGIFEGINKFQTNKNIIFKLQTRISNSSVIFHLENTAALTFFGPDLTPTTDYRSAVCFNMARCNVLSFTGIPDTNIQYTLSWFDSLHLHVWQDYIKYGLTLYDDFTGTDDWKNVTRDMRLLNAEREQFKMYKDTYTANVVNQANVADYIYSTSILELKPAEEKYNNELNKYTISSIIYNTNIQYYSTISSIHVSNLNAYLSLLSTYSSISSIEQIVQSTLLGNYIVCSTLVHEKGPAYHEALLRYSAAVEQYSSISSVINIMNDIDDIFASNPSITDEQLQNALIDMQIGWDNTNLNMVGGGTESLNPYDRTDDINTLIQYNKDLYRKWIPNQEISSSTYSSLLSTDIGLKSVISTLSASTHTISTHLFDARAHLSTWSSHYHSTDITYIITSANHSTNLAISKYYSDYSLKISSYSTFLTENQELTGLNVIVRVMEGGEDATALLQQTPLFNYINIQNIRIPDVKSTIRTQQDITSTAFGKYIYASTQVYIDELNIQDTLLYVSTVNAGLYQGDIDNAQHRISTNIGIIATHPALMSSISTSIGICTLMAMTSSFIFSSVISTTRQDINNRINISTTMHISAQNAHGLQIMKCNSLSSQIIENRITISTISSQIRTSVSSYYILSTQYAEIASTLKSFGEDVDILSIPPIQAGGAAIDYTSLLTAIKQFSTNASILNSKSLYNEQKNLIMYKNVIQKISCTINIDISDKIVSSLQSNVSTQPLSYHLTVRDALNDMNDLIKVEYNMKMAYWKYKNKYDIEMYNNLTGLNKMNIQDFQNLTINMDTTIYNCNYYINSRKALSNTINGYIANMSTNYIISYENYKLLTETSQYFDTISRSNKYISSSIPIKMSFSTINARVNYFSTSDENVSMCGVSSLYTNAPIINIPVIPEPTTTLLTRRGKRIQRIQITAPNNSFEIAQIIAVDSTGRNRAFLKPVSVGNIRTYAQSAQIITNGYTYSTEQVMRLGPTDPALVFTSRTPIIISIDLGTDDDGEEYDITAIQYLKKPGSSYNTTGVAFNCFDSNSQSVFTYTVPINQDMTTMDLRLVDGSQYPLTVYPIRPTICGFSARYVRISPPTSMPTGFTFLISQIAVTDSFRNNVVLNISNTGGAGFTSTTPVTYFPDGYSNISNNTTTDNRQNNISLIVCDGSYRTRPSAQCIRIAATSANSYIEVDLGTEIDVTSVHLFNAVDDGTPNAYLPTCRVSLITEDFLPVQTRSYSNPTNFNKQVFDFRNNGNSNNCSTVLKWPSYYGDAGIKTRYIRIQRDASLEFSYITAINKNGLNIAYGKQVTATATGQGATILGPYNAVQDKSTRVVSLTGTRCTILIDLGQLTEICGLTFTGTGTSNYESKLKNASIDLLDANSGLNTSITIKSEPSVLWEWDLRYEPDAPSKYPYEETAWVRKQIRIGTYAQTVLIETTGININAINETNIIITDGTGKKVPLVAAVTQTIYGKEFAALELGRSWEINTVSVTSTIPSTNMILIKDCNGYIVGLDYPTTAQPVSSSISVANTIKYADFRKDSTVGATYPYPVNYGPKGTGVKARYIEVLPPNSTTPICISQIIAVNACGRNVAIEKDTYASQPKPANASKAANAVDGLYEQEYIDNMPLLLMYQNYLQKPIEESFQSNGGAGDKWIVDLGRFIQVNPDDTANICDNQVYTSACYPISSMATLYEHEINCVIFIAPIGKENEFQNTTVNLIDDAGNIVGSSRITTADTNHKYVDFLDFRRDIGAPLDQAVVEPLQRITKTNIDTVSPPTGLMIQYVRVEQIPKQFLPTGATLRPIEVSKLIVYDNDNNDIARYKPTKSFSTSGTTDDLSYRAVDNIYLQKIGAEAYISGNGPGEYLEVNLGCEMGVVAAEIVPIIGYDAVAMNQLRFKMYNGNHDLVLAQKILPNMGNSISVADSNSVVIIPSVGVSIHDTFFNTNYLAGISPISFTQQVPPRIPSIPALTTVNAQIENITYTYPWAPANSPQIGTLANYVRVLNLNSYIQISQIMAFNETGDNILDNISSNNVFATNMLPGFPPENAVDGVGGFLHVPRPENQCYISERKKYEYWQARFPSTMNIIGVKYIPPNTNYARNKGTRIQLLDSTQNVISESILERSGLKEYYVDFRKPPVTGMSLSEFCMPRMQDIGSSWTTAVQTPACIAEDSTGNIYITDFLSHVIYKSVYNAATSEFSAPTIFFGTLNTVKTDLTGLNSPVGIVFFNTRLYVADSGNNRVLRITTATPITATVFLSYTNTPYGLAIANNTLCVSQNISSGLILFYSLETGGTVSPSIRMSGGSPTGLAAHILNGTTYLYAAYSSEQCVRVYNMTAGRTETSMIIGNGGTGNLNVTFQSPTDVKVDPTTNTVIITDSLGNTMYYVSPNDQSVIRLAGTGQGGSYQDPTNPAIKSMLLYPMMGCYHVKTGDYLVCDQGNASVRRLYITSQKRALTYTSNKASMLWNTTTLAAGPNPTLSTPRTTPGTNNTETISVLNTLARIQLAQSGSNPIFTVSNTNTVVVRTLFGSIANTITAMYTVVNNYYVATVGATNTNSFVYRCPITSPLSQALIFTLPSSTQITSLCVDEPNIYYIYGYTIRKWNSQTHTIIVGIDGQTSSSPITSQKYAINVALGLPKSLAFDSTNNVLYFIDSTHSMLYKVDLKTGILYPITNESTDSTGIVMNTRSNDTPIDANTIKLTAPVGVALGSDNTIYVSHSNQIIQFKNIYYPNGTPYVSASVYAGFSQTGVTGEIQADENAIAKWAPIRPGLIVMGQNNTLFISETNRISRIVPESYDVYAKGNTGVMRYSPIQLIGNATIEGNVLTTSSKDFIYTSFNTTHAVTDDEGNLYFLNIIDKYIYKVSRNNIITVIVNFPYTGTTYNMCIYNSAYIYISVDKLLYSVKIPTTAIATVALTTVIPITTNPVFGFINAVCAHQYGYLFFAEVASQTSLTNITTITYIRVSGTSPYTKVKLSKTIPIPVIALCMDTSSNLYAAGINGIIYKVSLTIGSTSITNVVTPIAGIDIRTSTVPTGDIATSALATILGKISDLCFSPSENCLYITTTGRNNNRVRRLDLDTDIIMPYVGQANSGYPINGALPATTTLMKPIAVCADSQGTLYVIDTITPTSCLMIKIPFYLFLKENVVYPIAGTGIEGFSGDGSYSQSARLNGPRAARYDSNGNIFIADTDNNCVRMIDSATGFITTIAGTAPNPGYSGDGGLAILGQLRLPWDIAISPTGLIYIADNYCIRRLKMGNANKYLITTVAGTGVAAMRTATAVPANGTLGKNVAIGNVISLDTDKYNNLYYLDTTFNIIFKLDIYNRITRVYGDFTNPLANPRSIKVSYNSDKLYVADGNTIYTIPINTTATIQKTILPISDLIAPRGLTVDSAGKLYYVDGARIKSYTPTTLTTIIGNGTTDFIDPIIPTAGIRDNILAVNAKITNVFTLDINPINGRLLISDSDQNRVRYIPTASPQNGILAKSIRIDSAGIGYTISKINIYKDNLSLLTLVSNPFIGPTLQSQSYTFDGAGVTISYITIKGDANLVDSVVYLYNNNNNIISTRILTSDVTLVNGETLVYLSPFSTNYASIPNVAIVQKSCGTPTVNSIIIEIPEVFQIYGTASATTQYTSQQAQTFVTNNNLTFASPAQLERARILGANWPVNSWTKLNSGLVLEKFTDTGATNALGTTGYPTVYGYKSVLPPNTIAVNFNSPQATMGLCQLFKSVTVITSGTNGPIGTVYSIGTTDSKFTISLLNVSEVIGIFMERSYGSNNSDIKNIKISLNTTDTNYLSPILASKILESASNPIREFIDFRQTNTTNTCASLDAIYNQLIASNRVRYIRILSSDTTPLRIGAVSVLSFDTGEDVGVAKTSMDNTGAPYNIGTTMTTPTWVEMDLEYTYPIEHVIITPPPGCTIDYTVQAYTEQRELVSIPSPNPMSLKTKYIRIQGSGYSADSSVQIASINAYGPTGCAATTGPLCSISSIATTNLITNQTATVDASTAVPATAVADFNKRFILEPDSRYFYRSQSSAEDAYAEITLNTESRIAKIIYNNRTDCCQNMAYGMRLLQYNAQRQLLQQNYMAGDFTSETYMNTIGCYSIIPITPRKGILGVRYVKYENTPGTPIQISQLIVQDVNGRNVALNKQIRLSSTGNASMIIDGRYKCSAFVYNGPLPPSASQFVEINLGVDCEIDKVIYYNAATGQNNASGAIISLFDVNNKQLGEQSLQGNLPREVIDFKNNSVVYARYVSIENPGTLLSGGTSLRYDVGTNTITGDTTLQIQSVSILDINGRELSQGKYITQTETRWEIDLLQECPILSVKIIAPTNAVMAYYKHTPITLYDADRNIIKQVYLGTITTGPILVNFASPPTEYTSSETQIDTPITYEKLTFDTRQNTSATPVRFIHIDGVPGSVMHICQVVAIDINNVNVAIGKPTVSSYEIFPAYNAVNGLCDSVFKTSGDSPFLEVDLGAEYYIKQLYIYCGGNVASCTYYRNQREPASPTVFTIKSWNGNTPVFLTPGPFPFMMPRFGIGKKARFVRLQRAGPLIFSQLAVIDALGRNVALGLTGQVYPSRMSNSTGTGTEGTYTGGKNTLTGFNRDNIKFIQIGDSTSIKSWFELDLMNEYWITDIVFYSGDDTYSSNVSVSLRDNYQNIVLQPQNLRNSSVNTTVAIATTLVSANPTSNQCPLNTKSVRVSNTLKCYENCNRGDAENPSNTNTCYTTCPENSIVNPYDIKQCMKCPDGYSIIRDNSNFDGQCSADCPVDYIRRVQNGVADYKKCDYSVCLADEDDRPASLQTINGLQMCATDCTKDINGNPNPRGFLHTEMNLCGTIPSTLPLTTPVDNVSLTLGSRLTVGLVVDDIETINLTVNTRFTNYFYIYINVQLLRIPTFYSAYIPYYSANIIKKSDYNNYINSGLITRAYKYYTYPTRPSIETPLIPLINISNYATNTPTNSEVVYTNRPIINKTEVPPINIVENQNNIYYKPTNTVNRYYTKDPNYDTIYTRSVSNPVYYIGRSSAEIIDLTNSTTPPIFPLNIPTPSTLQCQYGYTQYNSSSGTPQCITDCSLYGTLIEITDDNNNQKKVCYDSCANGIVDPLDNTRCIDACNPDEVLSQDKTKCIKKCPSFTTTVSEEACILCNGSDTNTNPYTLDTGGNYFDDTCYYNRYKTEIDNYSSGRRIWNGGSGIGGGQDVSISEKHYNEIGLLRGYTPGCTGINAKCITSKPSTAYRIGNKLTIKEYQWPTVRSIIMGAAYYTYTEYSPYYLIKIATKAWCIFTDVAPIIDGIRRYAAYPNQPNILLDIIASGGLGTQVTTAWNTQTNLGNYILWGNVSKWVGDIDYETNTRNIFTKPTITSTRQSRPVRILDRKIAVPLITSECGNIYNIPCDTNLAPF